MPKLIVPVGLDLGATYAEEGPPDRLPIHYDVHLGATPIELTAEEYTVWRAAFAQSDVHFDLKHDRQALETFVRQNGQAPVGLVPDPGPIVDRLLGLQLLAEFDPDDDLEEFLGVHRLYPRAEGVGTDEDDPMLYGIGDEEKVFCNILPNVFSVWMDSATAPSLWDACQDLVEQDAHPEPGEEPVGLTIGEVAYEIAEVLPWMVSIKAAWLDLVNYDLPRLEAPMSFPPDRDRLVSQRRDPLIIPVGLSLGRCYYGVPEDEREERYWAVHFGIDYVELTADESTAWTGVSFDFHRAARHEVTRPVLERFLRDEENMRRPGQVVDSLLERGLLVELDPEEGDLEELFGRVQLYPLREGFGNSFEQPGLYEIGRNGDMLVGIPWEQYTLWSHSLLCRSLWDACVQLAGDADSNLQPGEQSMNWTPEWLAEGMAVVLPALLTSGCAYLEPLNYTF